MATEFALEIRSRIGLGSPLPDQTRETPVGQDLAAGLARRAVRDLVRLVGDPPEVVLAHRTVLAVAAVNREVIADLGLEAARTAPLRRERLVQYALDRGEELLPLPRLERRERRVRRELGAVQDVVRVPAADARHGPLVAQDRVHAPAVLPLQDQPLELGRAGLGPELVERSVVAFGQHPPAGLALATELLHQHRRAVLETEPHDGAARLGRLRRVLDVDASALRQVHEDAGPVELPDQVLPT